MNLPESRDSLRPLRKATTNNSRVVSVAQIDEANDRCESAYYDDIQARDLGGGTRDRGSGTKVDRAANIGWLVRRVDAVLLFTLVMTVLAALAPSWGPSPLVLVALIGLAGVSVKSAASSGAMVVSTPKKRQGR